MQTIVNKVQLIGRLGMDAETRTFGTDQKMTRVSIATPGGFKEVNGKKEQIMDWHTLVAWGKTAEIAGKYFKKGMQVAIDGKLVHRTYEDKEGKKQYTSEVHISDFKFLDKKEN